ncbi:NTP transferase domain-containing protein [Shewanella sp. NIFS-20-20]|uniref:NTP transferase domain-containing protein n=1 Tax=Shewanella sp. NIFS-20-20 TaxID=2853806 RepID=UPI001C47F35A|nr:NTP transferase domain-containing protein [Shewanella sp. NIFS-20-20]MBV7315391.1 NTP transferase domain-containing protein [Shewanella sp. NIFS-20-20]
MSTSLTLVVLAAGLGSRFGGDKQLAALGPQGESLLLLSMMSAQQAGFTRAVLVIRPEIETAVARMLAPIEASMEIVFVYQDLDDMPLADAGGDRVKPWGTAQALFAARHVVTGPMAVVTADDFYGQLAFSVMATALANATSDWHMVAYQLDHTLSEHGGVNRGICQVSHGTLERVQEWVNIEATATGLVGDYQGQTLALANDVPVSMTFWGFTPAIFPCLTHALTEFIKHHGQSLTAECYLPDVVQTAIDNGQVLRVWPTTDKWLGVTYPQDAHRVRTSLMEYWGD